MLTPSKIYAVKTKTAPESFASGSSEKPIPDCKNNTFLPPYDILSPHSQFLSGIISLPKTRYSKGSPMVSKALDNGLSIASEGRLAPTGILLRQCIQSPFSPNSLTILSEYHYHSTNIPRPLNCYLPKISSGSPVAPK